MPLKIIVGITGATGTPIAMKVLQLLRKMQVEIYLVVSDWGKKTMQHECNLSYDQLAKLADNLYDIRDLGACISSGSFPVNGMVIVPCSMKTLAGIRTGYTDNLIIRAADVMLKERHPLVIAPREAPLNSIHLDNMLYLANMGAIIFPPVPAFYHSTANIDQMLHRIAARMLDQLRLGLTQSIPWSGLPGEEICSHGK